MKKGNRNKNHLKTKKKTDTGTEKLVENIFKKVEKLTK